jgi:hypothetical protein
MSKTDPSRRDFLRASPALAAPLLADAPQLQRPRSNVILVISDQFRWDCLGVNARTPLGLTPNLDDMARDGMNFANAITNQPVCAPSRSCIFTGQYANRHGVWRNGPPLPTERHDREGVSERGLHGQLHRQMAPRARRSGQSRDAGPRSTAVSWWLRASPASTRTSDACATGFAGPISPIAPSSRSPATMAATSGPVTPSTSAADTRAPSTSRS